jgi:hypothetical protein
MRADSINKGEADVTDVKNFITINYAAASAAF